jgi:hypothetical protein
MYPICRHGLVRVSLISCAMLAAFIPSWVHAEGVTEATSQPSAGSNIVIKASWPKGISIAGSRWMLQDANQQYNTIDAVKDPSGEVQFNAPYRPGLRIVFNIVIDGKSYVYRRDLKKEAMKDGAFCFHLPLDRAGRAFKCKVFTLGETRSPVAGVLVVARKGRKSVFAGRTNSKGIVEVRVDPLDEITLSVEKMPVSDGAAHLWLDSPPKKKVPTSISFSDVFEFPVRLPTLSLRLKVTFNGESLGKEMRSLRCIPLKRRKGVSSFYQGETRNGIAYFVGIPDGQYRIQLWGRDRRKYIPQGNSVVTIRSGKLTDHSVNLVPSKTFRGTQNFRIVEGGSQKWINGVTVQITGVDHKIKEQKKTAGVGMASFTDLPGGRYQVVAEADGYKTFHGKIEVPGDNLVIPMIRAYTLTIKPSVKEDVMVAVLYQNSRGEFRERGVEAKNGAFTIQVSGLASTAVVLVIGRDGSIGGQFLDVKEDATVNVKLLESKKVSIPIEGEMPKAGRRYASLWITGVGTPLMISGKVNKQAHQGHAKLPFGTYDVYLRISKKGCVRIAENWVFDQATPVKPITLPKKMTPVLTLDNMSDEFLKKNGKKSIRPVAPTPPPARKPK